MNATRLVQPEILDRLAEDEPGALRSRRDLRMINHLLGSERWFHRTLSSRPRTDARILELGAGEGRLGRRLMEAGLGSVAGLDLARRPPHWPGRAAWFQMSVFHFAGWSEHPIVIGNLVFHHFSDGELATLGAKLNAHARLIVANEPLRARRAERLFSALCPLINADPVTRHDGRVSIEAGFRGDELPALLRLDPEAWSWSVNETMLGACRFVAERNR